jgi:hypothetical protein
MQNGVNFDSFHVDINDTLIASCSGVIYMQIKYKSIT